MMGREHQGVGCFMGSTREPLPADTEERLAGFTELAATAIASAQAYGVARVR
jgi:hypothetical protein